LVVAAEAAVVSAVAAHQVVVPAAAADGHNLTEAHEVVDLRFKKMDRV